MMTDFESVIVHKRVPETLQEAKPKAGMFPRRAKKKLRGRTADGRRSPEAKITSILRFAAHFSSHFPLFSCSSEG
jgi:hypothetical protein